MPLTLTSLARAAAACAAVFLMANPATAAALPSGFAETQVAAGLRSPTAFAFAPDGRLFVCEQGGTLRVISGGTLLSTPFVTLTVNASGERGLLGIAFDPDFLSNHFVYVYYTATTPNVHNRVSRFTASGNVAMPGSEVMLLNLEPLGATNHNGGAIHFGADGKLYVAVGENAVRANAQTLSNRLGKILRINADGSIPEDNPFFMTATGANRAIWALGLRNPFTFAFEPLSGAMHINDVGENTWEEINEGVAGANYGWPTTEGFTSDPRFRSPLYAYDHSNGCAISGAAFHDLTRPQFPLRYWSSYFFADFCGGWIRSRLPGGAVVNFASGIANPVDLQFGADGALYYLARGSGSATGVVFRIAYTEEPPRVDISANGEDGPLELTSGSALQVDFSFDAGASGSIEAGEIYLGLFSPFGMFWVDAVQGFVPTPARAYAGAISTFGPLTLANFPDVAGLAAGTYLWFIVIDDQVDGIADGDFGDIVVTTIH